MPDKALLVLRQDLLCFLVTEKRSPGGVGHSLAPSQQWRFDGISKHCNSWLPAYVPLEGSHTFIHMNLQANQTVFIGSSHPMGQCFLSSQTYETTAPSGNSAKQSTAGIVAVSTRVPSARLPNTAPALVKWHISRHYCLSRASLAAADQRGRQGRHLHPSAPGKHPDQHPPGSSERRYLEHRHSARQ